MDQPALLSPSDVSVIRRYVRTKYAPLSESERADIVATAIRETLRRRMPDLPADLKTRIADELIRKCLVSERRDIRPDDVLDVCAEIELPDPASEYVILEPVLRWMNERAPGSWDSDKLFRRIFKRSPEPALGQIAASAEIAGAERSRAETPASRLPAFVQARLRPIALALVVLAGGTAAGIWLARPADEQTAPVPAPLPELVVPQAEPDVGMPRALRFREIDTATIKAYLAGRDSMLAEEPYFGAILESARVHDVNPLLLFAITGQEQGFVPKSGKYAKEIANNPFNVYNSWKKYNTDIRDSADIAARTVSRRGAVRPEGHDPFDWLNKRYAEHELWGEGVRSIFRKLESLSPVSATENRPEG